jgi:hypothetical protein
MNLVSLLLVAGLVGADPSALTIEQMKAENSRLLGVIQKLESRIDALESTISPVTKPKVHGLTLDPEGTGVEGGRWVSDPDSGQVIFAENEWIRRYSPSGSLYLTLIRRGGKPVAVESVTYGAAKPSTTSGDSSQRDVSLPSGQRARR